MHVHGVNQEPDQLVFEFFRCGTRELHLAGWTRFLVVAVLAHFVGPGMFEHVLFVHSQKNERFQTHNNVAQLGRGYLAL